MKDWLSYLRKICDRLKKKKINLERHIDCIKYYYISGMKKKLVLLNTPTHGNYGDHAIAIAEKEFLREYFPNKSICEIPDYWLRRDFNIWKKVIRKGDVLLCHGGGYLGNLWLCEEEILRKLMYEFPNNRIIILPQTVYYYDNKEGQEEIQKSLKAYNSHKTNLKVFLRDRSSYVFFTETFKEVKYVYCVPDIVTFLINNNKVSRKGVLLCFRNDKEKDFKDELKQIVRDWISKNKLEFQVTDTCTDECFGQEERIQKVQGKLSEFSSAKLVLTDRLHGMLFAAVTGTPCLAFDNISKKISGGYEWIRELPYIKICTAKEELGYKLDEMLKISSNTFSYNNEFLRKYFDLVANEIADK